MMDNQDTPSVPTNTFTPGSGFAAAFGQPSPAPEAVNPGAAKPKGAGKGLVIAGFLILMVAAGVVGLGSSRSFLSKASSADCTPSRLNEEVTSNSAEIAFATATACQVNLFYSICDGVSAGDSQDFITAKCTKDDKLSLKVPESLPSLNHRFRIAPLLPGQYYSYKLMVDDKDLGSVRFFRTKLIQAVPSEAVVPTALPTKKPVLTGSAGKAYTLTDFEDNFGTAKAEFDYDKNGIVNMRDWLLYQKSRE